MKCPNCNTAELGRSVRAHHYTECGLANIFLKNIEVDTCPACGEEVIHVPAIADLHRLIARRLVTKQGALAPDEIRFLRKQLGWGADDFARQMFVTEGTVAAWEGGRARLGEAHEILLRMFVATREPKTEYDSERGEPDVQPHAKELLEAITKATRPPPRLDFRHKRDAMPAWLCDEIGRRGGRGTSVS